MDFHETNSDTDGRHRWAVFSANVDRIGTLHSEDTMRGQGDHGIYDFVSVTVVHILIYWYLEVSDCVQQLNEFVRVTSVCLDLFLLVYKFL